MFGLFGSISTKAIDERIASAVTAARSYFMQWADAFGKRRAPSASELIRQYASIVYTASNINAAAVASAGIRLYVRRQPGERQTRFATRMVSPETSKWLRKTFGRKAAVGMAAKIEEVESHPALDVLESVNEHLDGYGLWELTSLYCDVSGRAYWLVPTGPMGVPSSIWIAPPQYTCPHVESDGELTHYEFRAGPKSIDFDPEDVIPFRSPSLRDPYFGGHGPAEAMIEESDLVRSDTSMQTAYLKNRGRPELIVTPKDVSYGMDEQEAERFTARFRRLLTKSGAGGVLAHGTPLDFHELTMASREMEGLNRRKVNREEIFNAFGIPISFVTTQTNLANLEAGMVQHGRFAVVPRLTRICQVLNQRFITKFDQSGRFFFGFENPIPEDEERKSRTNRNYLDSGVMIINDARAALGLDPVPWGEKPWQNSSWVQPSDDPTLNERRKPEPFSFLPGGPRPEDDEDETETEDKPKPDAEDEDSEEAAEEKKGAVFGILADMAIGSISRKSAIARLVKRGVDLPVAFDWTEPPAIKRDEPQCSERDADFTHPEWHKGAQTKQGGHHRRLPRGEKIKSATRSVFREQKRELLRKMKAIRWRKDEQDMTRAIQDIDWSEWDQELARKVRPAVEVHYDDGLREAAARYGMSDDPAFSVTNPRVRRAIDEAAMALSAEANGVTQTELQDKVAKLRADLANGILGDDTNTPAELTRIVQEVFGHAEKYRSERIALTESSRAVHTAQRMAAKESGIVLGFELLLSDDACDFCIEVKSRFPDGIPLDGNFGSAVTYENGPSTIKGSYDQLDVTPIHPHCMCTMTEKIDWAALNREEP